MALSQAISHFLNQHCSPWKAVSLERDEYVSSGQVSAQAVDIHASGLQSHAVLRWNDDRAYYPKSELMNGVVSSVWPKDTLTSLLFSSFVSANWEGGPRNIGTLRKPDYDCCVSKQEGVFRERYQSFLSENLETRGLVRFKVHKRRKQSAEMGVDQMRCLI
jgi:hypothetical protein